MIHVWSIIIFVTVPCLLVSSKPHAMFNYLERQTNAVTILYGYWHLSGHCIPDEVTIRLHTPFLTLLRPMFVWYGLMGWNHS
jgi:hypothetical protein